MSIESLRRRLADRGDEDRGVVLLEFAILSTIMVVLVFGIVEMGLAWQTRLTVQGAARSSARTVSSLGKDRLADYSALVSVRAGLNDVGLSNVEFVIVFDASAANGAIPPTCLTPTPTPQTNKCNVYTGADLQTLSQASFTGTTSCTGSSPDRFWCPLSRLDRQAVGVSTVGVQVIAKHKTLTGIFGQSIKITDQAVMEVEPKQ